MKRLISIILVMALVMTSVFATQKTYRLSSDEVQEYLLLRKASSSLTPDPTFPITASQLSKLVKSLDPSDFSDEYVELYNNLIKKLDEVQLNLGSDKIGMDFDPEILGIEYIKSNDDDINIYDILPYKDRAPFTSLKTTIHMTDNFTGYIDLDVRKTSDTYESGKGVYITTVKDIFANGNPLNFPNTAYASIGTDKINFTIGRDRLGNGNGYTGNLQFGENLAFEDFAKFSFVSNKLSYDFSIDTIKMNNDEDIHINSPRKNIFVHRLSYAFSNKFSFTMYEGALTYSPAVTDLEFLNPFMILHNIGSYYDASTNNFVGFEFVAKLPKKVQLSGQFFLDQIGFSTEAEDYLSSGENAFAALLNASKTTALFGGIVDFYGEVVYGNPFVYLKNNHGYGMNENAEMGTYKYHTNFPAKEEGVTQIYDPTVLDYVADLATQINDNARDVQYIGYKYGGDLFSFAVGAKYINKDLKVNAGLQFLAKGDYGIRENESRCAEGRADYDWTQSKANYANNGGEHKLQTTFKGVVGVDYTLFKGIKLSAKASALYHMCYQHNSVNKFDFQYCAGVSVNPLAFFEK